MRLPHVSAEVDASPKRVALVTGGGGGLGSALARSLSDQGLAVVVAGRTLEGLERVASELEDGHAEQLDVSSDESWEALLRSVENRCGPIDVLVSTAGVITRGPFLESSPEDWDGMIRTNVLGTMRGVRTLGPGMLERGFGRIICITSVAAHLGCTGRAVYGASKGAVESFVRAMGVELAGTGVTANCIAPGAFRTEFNSDFLAPGTPSGDATLAAIPEDRFGDPDELGAAVAYLIAAAYSQGATLHLDGGWSIRG